MKTNLQRFFELIALSRPEWGFIFSGVAFMLGLLFLLPEFSLLVGWLSIYAFTCSHFSLNGLYDRKSDEKNPRGFSLRNPLVHSTLLTPKIVYGWCAILWVGGLLLSFLTPTALSFPKNVLILLTFVLAISGSVFYSKPPLRFKARPFIDIITTILIIGMLFPVWVSLLGIETIVDLNLLFLGIVLNILLVIGILLPTILTDLDTDLQIGERTTAVALGWERASYLTGSLIFLRILGFAFINILLMIDGILTPSIIPFFLGLIEFSLAVNLIYRRNRDAVLLLWKTVIVTSILGGIVFGFLYL